MTIDSPVHEARQRTLESSPSGGAAAETVTFAGGAATDGALRRSPALPAPLRRPATLLALQRSVGNRDVQRLLAGDVQRQKPPAAGPAAAPAAPGVIAAGLFNVQGGEVQQTGDKV